MLRAPRSVGESAIENRLNVRAALPGHVRFTPESGHSAVRRVVSEFQGNYGTTTAVAKVTIELQDMKKADRDAAEQARKAATLKKGLSD